MNIKIEDLSVEQLNMLVMHALSDPRYSLRWFKDGQEDIPYDFQAMTVFSSATNPCQAYPIILAYGSCTERIPGPDKLWRAYFFDAETHLQYAATPLDAAMRTFLHKQFGPEVRLP
jgi:hypothetical protein